LTRKEGRGYGTRTPYPFFPMRTDAKKKSLEAVKRLEGLITKLHTMIDGDAYCTEILELALAMQGHVKHIQAAVLESHLHTCAGKKLASPKDKDAFIAEVLKVVGLSRR